MKWSESSAKTAQLNLKIVCSLLAVVLLAVMVFPSVSLASQDKIKKDNVGTAAVPTGTLRITLETLANSSNLPEGAGFTYDTSYTFGSTTIPDTTITGLTTASPFTQVDTLAVAGLYKVNANVVDGYVASVVPNGVKGLDSLGSLHFVITYLRKESNLGVNIEANGSGGSYSISGPTDYGFPSDFTDITGQTVSSPFKVPTGTYIVTFTEVAGYSTTVTSTVRSILSGSPVTGTKFSETNPSTGMLHTYEEHIVNGVYTLDEGTLIVNITDNDSGGSFSISGPPGFFGGSGISGVTDNFSEKVPTGNYTVTFTTVDGYNTDITATTFSIDSNIASGSLNKDATETVNGVYNLAEATLNVNITANGSPGSFSISGPSGFSPISGQTSNYSATVPPGSYTVTFTTPSGFDLALSATSFTVGSSSASGTLSGGGSETMEGVYTEHTGSLQGFIEPAAAKNDGGQWRLKNASDWRDSSNVASGIPIGTYTVEFKAITAWTKPSDATVTIEKDETTTVTGVYTEGGGTGGLQVFITSNRSGSNKPLSAPSATVEVSGRIPAGAQWRPIYPSNVGPTSDVWYDSGHTITGLQIGDLGLEFKLVNGYILPDLRGATIRRAIISKYTGEYIRPLIIHKSDYDGNGTQDLPVFNESTRVWSVASVSGTGPAATRTILKQKFGFMYDIPATGDYDGDGIADLAVYREKAGAWIVHRQFTLENFGREDDIPVPGDYNGDGITDPALYRPDTGEWLIHDMDTNKTTVVNFGGAGYIPVPGNYDGDRQDVTDLGIYHVQSGQWKVAIYNSKKERWTKRKSYRQVFGTIGDIPIQGDYDGDGTTDHAYFDRSDSMWHVLDQFEIQHGKNGVIPVPNDWAGLGRVIPAYFNPVTGRWQAVDNLLRTKFGAGGRPLVSGR